MKQFPDSACLKVFGWVYAASLAAILGMKAGMIRYLRNVHEESLVKET
jgi:hypothetical protein